MSAVREIVIVPAWRRPDFLLAALRRLEIADDGNQEYWIALDRRHDQRVNLVARAFTQRHGARSRTLLRSHGYRGNSYNVLTSYREAVQEGPDFIHLVEEDIFVSRDYFSFHRAAHALRPDVFAVSAARNQNHVGDPDPDPEALYACSQYQSLGVSFRPERLLAVLAHATPAYLRDPVTYCRRQFPRTQIPAANAEQDGLINRVVEAARAEVLYPALPRAYHAGFVGYHRKGLTLLGTVEQRADKLLAMTTEEMNAAAHSYPDHQVVDLDAHTPPPTRMIAWP